MHLRVRKKNILLIILFYDQDDKEQYAAVPHALYTNTFFSGCLQKLHWILIWVRMTRTTAENEIKRREKFSIPEECTRQDNCEWVGVKQVFRLGLIDFCSFKRLNRDEESTYIFGNVANEYSVCELFIFFLELIRDNNGFLWNVMGCVSPKTRKRKTNTHLSYVNGTPLDNKPWSEKQKRMHFCVCFESHCRIAFFLALYWGK